MNKYKFSLRNFKKNKFNIAYILVGLFLIFGIVLINLMFNILIFNSNSPISQMDGYDIKIFSSKPLSLQNNDKGFETSEIYINKQQIKNNQKVLYVQLNDNAKDMYGIEKEENTIYTTLDAQSEIINMYSEVYNVTYLENNINTNVEYVIFPDNYNFETQNDAEYIYYLSNEEGSLSYRNEVCKKYEDEYEATCSKKFDIYNNITTGLNILIISFVLIMLASIYTIQELAALQFKKTKETLTYIGLNKKDINIIYLLERFVAIIIIALFSIVLTILFGRVTNIEVYSFITIFTLIIIALLGIKTKSKKKKNRKRRKTYSIDIKKYLVLSLKENRLLSILLLFLTITAFTISLLLFNTIQVYSIDARVSETINNDYLFEEVPLYDNENNKYYECDAINDQLVKKIQTNPNTVVQGKAAYRNEEDTDYGYTENYANLGVYTYEESLLDTFALPVMIGNEVIVRVNSEFGHYIDNDTFMYDNGKQIKVGDQLQIKGKQFRVTAITNELPIMTGHPKISILMNTESYEELYGDEYNILAVNTKGIYSNQFLEELQNDEINIISYEEVYKNIQTAMSKLYYISIIIIVSFILIIYVVLFNVLMMRIKIKRDEIKLFNDLGFEPYKVYLLMFGDQYLILLIGIISVFFIGIILNLDIIVLVKNLILCNAFLVLVVLTVKYVCKQN